MNKEVTKGGSSSRGPGEMWRRRRRGEEEGEIGSKRRGWTEGEMEELRKMVPICLHGNGVFLSPPCPDDDDFIILYY